MKIGFEMKAAQFYFNQHWFSFALLKDNMQMGELKKNILP